MPESARERFARWRVEEVLLRHPGLRLNPSAGDGVALAGELRVPVRRRDGGEGEDAYQVELVVPGGFPKAVATARETGGRIPPTFHKLAGGFLCLGAPTEVRLRLTRAPTVLAFVDELVVPYLYGYSHFAAHGVMPFGELAHGPAGLLEHFAGLFGVAGPAARQFVLLTSLRRRCANKLACPCGSGRWLGRCHHLKVNRLRRLLGRRWFRDELAALDAD